MVALTWQDKKPVHFFSTISPSPKSGEELFVKRRKKDGTIEHVPCPKVVQKYKYMGGIDQNDQMCSYYSVGIQTKKGPQDFFIRKEHCQCFDL